MKESEKELDSIIEAQGGSPEEYVQAGKDAVSFAVWYDKLVELAKAKRVLWLISDCPEDHRESYDDGMTPEDELDVQLDEAGSSVD
jgi:hypothetical protein